MKTIDCCPIPDGLYVPAKTVHDEIVGSGGQLFNSVYRGQDAVAELHACGKHTQAELYAMWLAGQGNPANPPGFSTHELFNDGIAYAVARGAALADWQCGMDVNDSLVAISCATFRKHAWIATVTYPGSASEYHHLNLREQPKVVPEPLHKGDKGPKVHQLEKHLHYLRAKGADHRYYDEEHLDDVFGPKLEDAVEHFQRDHHLQVDGKVGAHTEAQIEVSLAHQQHTDKVQALRHKLANAIKLRDAAKKRGDHKAQQHEQDRAEKLMKEIRELGADPTPGK